MTCKVCHTPTWRRGTPQNARPAGSLQRGPRGMCNSCYQRLLKTGKPSPRYNVPTLDRLAIPELTDDVRRAASLQVCGHAHTPDDARELLDVLGLLEASTP